VSDSFRIITEIVRRRVFADFSIANLLRFRDGKATGQVSVAPLFLHEEGCPRHEICKWNVLLHLEEKLGIPAARILAVGDSTNDICLLKQAGLGIAFEPKTDAVRMASGNWIQGDLRKVLEFCTNWESAMTQA